MACLQVPLAHMKYILVAWTSGGVDSLAPLSCVLPTVLAINLKAPLLAQTSSS